MARARAATIKPGVPAPGFAARLGETIDERRGVDYHVLRAASMVNRCSEPRMPFRWTANPYRGCEIGCRYCYARYTHGFLGMTDPDAFERTIYVKEIGRDRLLVELARARRSGLSVALGTATDPYQPAEGVFRVTRSVLEAARAIPGLRLSITTKSSLVERDLELLRTLAERSDVSVNLSITTVDAALARRLEPRAPRPDLRFRTMRALAAGGIAPRLFVMPVLPYLTDGDDNLTSLVSAARRAGAQSIEWNPLFLRPGTRETFFAFLRSDFPLLVERYERLYRTAYVPRAWAAALDARMRRLVGAAALSGCSRADRPGPRAPEQLALVW